MPELPAGFFTGQAVPSRAPVAQTPGLIQASAPQASAPVAPLPGLTGFVAPQKGTISGSATGSVPRGSDTTLKKKSRLDGTLDPSDLDAEIARYERELAEQKPPQGQPSPALAQETGRIVTTPNVNPNVDGGDPLASAFLTPEELSRLQGSDSFPTRRMPLGPGQQ